MKIPLGLKLGLLVVGTTMFYTYVGQLVPQKEVQPPQVIELKKDITTAELVAIGRQIADGKGLCLTCHTLGKKGALRFPDLEGVATRAASREPGLDALHYFAKSLYEPDSFILPGFSPGMPKINKPPIGLTDQEILAVISWLESLGGTPTVTLETKLPYGPAGAPAGG